MMRLRKQHATVVAFGQHARDIFLADAAPRPLEEVACVHEVRDPTPPQLLRRPRCHG